MVKEYPRSLRGAYLSTTSPTEESRFTDIEGNVELDPSTEPPVCLEQGTASRHGKSVL